MRVRTTLVIVMSLAAALSACGSSSNDAGTTAASAGSGGTSVATGATSTGTTGTSGPSGASGATSTGPTGASAATGSIPPTDLEDGRHFGFIDALHAGGVVRFDLAYFLTGDDATQAAEEHGDEAPPPNDYYIVNDNPRLRTLALAPDVEIDMLDWNRCCDVTVIIDVATLRRALAAGADGIDVNGALVRGGSPYWLTLDGGVVTKIEEQFLP